jgi:hypothetical protein
MTDWWTRPPPYWGGAASIGIVRHLFGGGMVHLTGGGMAMKVIVLKVRRRENLDELDEVIRRGRT